MSIEINSIKNNPLPSPSDLPPSGQRTGVTFKTNPLPQDKVEISSKKKGLSNGAKIGIGVGIISVVGLAFELIWGKGKHLKSFWEKISGKGVSSSNATNESKKYVDRIDDIKENFSKIFAKDFTKDEANELALKYKEIFETEDNNEFMKNIWLQLNKDYKLPDIPYSLTEENSSTLASFSPFGGVNYNTNEKMKWIIEKVVNNGMEKERANFVKVDRLSLIRELAHELRHAKQKEMACRVSPQEMINAYIDRGKKNNEELWQEAMNNCRNNVSNARRYCNDKLNRVLLPSYKNLEKSPVGSPEYQEGLRQIEGIRNYVTSEVSMQGYWNQFVEVEARDAGNRMEQIYKWLTNK